MPPKILVVGLGNTLRGDDALGRIVAEQLRDVVDPSDVLVVDQHGPTPELAAELAKVERVIFLDASAEGPADRVVARRLEPAGPEALAHRLDASGLLGLTLMLYGRVPEAYAVTFRGRTFDLADCRLSPEASEAKEAIFEQTMRLIRPAAQRREITVCGVVQGVGFRPFVHRLARKMKLSGSVRNRSGKVLIEVQGAASALDRFLEQLAASPPPLGQVDSVSWRLLPQKGESDFRIEASDRGTTTDILLAADMATCDDCLRELFDPADRRYRYPFLNCTNCGPRLTIIKGAPYDRERTTMAGFAMCPECRAEYLDPSDRRFHAQPTACPVCGPHLALRCSAGHQIASVDPLATFARLVRHGKIGALKGLGGFHLVCSAVDEQAVATLRTRKGRYEKPLAVMVADVETAEQLCELSDDERRLLVSPERPIVLLRKRRNSQPAIAESVAPGNPSLGVMLPYTPLHHLLLAAVDRLPLVMTSGNRSDEPIAYCDDDAATRLGDIVDVFLTHDRPIHVRCDDSVTRIVAGAELPNRRSRGYAPHPLPLPLRCTKPILAVGGQLKGTFALGRGRQAIMSHHLGDLDHFAAYEAFEKDIALYQQLFGFRPQIIACDLHPDYASTAYAQRRAERESVPLLQVQHHHAHVASCMAENGLNEPVIGVAFDGTGYGTDGTIWGGEFFVGNYGSFARIAHLRYVPMPGGDKAITEPWRMAIAHLLDADCDPDMVPGVDAQQSRTIERMIYSGLNSPLTSSIGRLFDAVAAITGLRTYVTHEGQAAMQLEWLASEVADGEPYPFKVADGQPMVIDTRPLIRAVAGDVRKNVNRRQIARRFHSTIVEIVVTVCERIRATSRLSAVALSGGVFLNALLTSETSDRLSREEYHVYRHRLVPPSDGGLSLGQVAIAAHALCAAQNPEPPRSAALSAAHA